MDSERELTAKEAAALVGEAERTIQHKLKIGQIQTSTVRGGKTRKRHFTTFKLLKEYLPSISSN